MSACRHRRLRTPTFPSPTHQDQRNAPSHRSFLDARGPADLDPLIVREGDAHSLSKREPQPPRYTISLVDPIIPSRRRGWLLSAPFTNSIAAPRTAGIDPYATFLAAPADRRASEEPAIRVRPASH